MSYNIEELLQKDDSDLTTDELIFVQGHIIHALSNQLEHTNSRLDEQGEVIVSLHERLVQLETAFKPTESEKQSNSVGIITSLY